MLSVSEECSVELGKEGIASVWEGKPVSAEMTDDVHIDPYPTSQIGNESMNDARRAAAVSTYHGHTL